jgi:hypothetical protein
MTHDIGQGWEPEVALLLLPKLVLQQPLRFARGNIGHTHAHAHAHAHAANNANVMY